MKSLSKIRKDVKEKAEIEIAKRKPKKLIKGFFCEDCGEILIFRAVYKKIGIKKTTDGLLSFYYQCPKCGFVYIY